MRCSVRVGVWVRDKMNRPSSSVCFRISAFRPLLGSAFSHLLQHISSFSFLLAVAFPFSLDSADKRIRASLHSLTRQATLSSTSATYAASPLGRTAHRSPCPHRVRSRRSDNIRPCGCHRPLRNVVISWARRDAWKRTMGDRAQRVQRGTTAGAAAPGPAAAHAVRDKLAG